MKVLSVIALMFLSLNVMALDLHGVKKSGTTLTILSADSFAKALNSNEMVCIKDGGRFIGGNKAYGSKVTGGKACASSEARQRTNKIAYGQEVTVIRLAELPEAVIKELSKN